MQLVKKVKYYHLRIKGTKYGFHVHIRNTLVIIKIMYYKQSKIMLNNLYEEYLKLTCA